MANCTSQRLHPTRLPSSLVKYNETQQEWVVKMDLHRSTNALPAVPFINHRGAALNRLRGTEQITTMASWQAWRLGRLKPAHPVGAVATPLQCGSVLKRVKNTCHTCTSTHLQRVPRETRTSMLWGQPTDRSTVQAVDRTRRGKGDQRNTNGR